MSLRASDGRCGLKLRLLLWLSAWLAISLVHAGDLWKQLFSGISADSLQNPYNALLLLLGLWWLWGKRRELFSRMRHGPANPGLAALGVALVVLAWFMPQWDRPGMVRLAAIGQAVSGLGLFVILFPRAAFLPALALAPVCLSLLITLAIATFLDTPFSLAPVLILVPALSALGLPIAHQGLYVSVLGPSGETVTTVFALGCSGHYAIAIAAALFLLMALDARLPARKMVPLLLAVLVGAWLQNLLRLALLLVIGHIWGESALWTAHRYLGPLLFVAFFALFAYIYFKMTVNARKDGTSMDTRTKTDEAVSERASL